MRSAGRIVRLAVVSWCLLPLTAFAQNGEVFSAVSLAIGQPPVQMALGAGQLARWYVLANAVAGRSYCAVTGLAPDYRYEDADTRVRVFRLDNNSLVLLGQNDNAAGTEPGATIQSRVCWMAPVGGDFYVQVAWPTTTPPSSLRYATLRVLETTLWCPWFFIAGDYNAFTLLHNATHAAVNVTVTWRTLAGVSIGTYTGSIPGNGGLALNARDYVAGATSGGIEVAHDGSPQAIQGSTTTLSGTTGVGFDALFTQRQPW